LNELRIKQMANSLLAIVNLKDPVGEVMRAWNTPGGLSIQKGAGTYRGGSDYL